MTDKQMTDRFDELFNSLNEDEKDLKIQKLENQLKALREKYQEPDPKTWSQYQQIKKENPTLYYTGKIQEQMIKDADTLGERFKDGNFNDPRFKENR
jgi:hypothetical protein